MAFVGATLCHPFVPTQVFVDVRSVGVLLLVSGTMLTVVAVSCTRLAATRS